MSAHEIETSQFEFAHGKRPSGRGYWAFRFFVPGSRPGIRSVEHLEFAPGDMLYSEAKQWAITRARELRASRVSVGS